MFWSDPNLYGATLPYRDPNTPVQTPFMGPVMPPWQNMQRFLPPPIYGFHPLFNLPPNVNPYMQAWIDPLQRRFDLPYMQTWIDPFQRRFEVPYVRPFDVPMYNLANPFRPMF